MGGNEPSEIVKHPVMLGPIDSAEIEFGEERKSCEGLSREVM